MDPTAPAWRALEDPAERRATDATPVAAASPRSAFVIGGAAALLAALAFLLAFATNAGGDVVVDGGAPLESPAAGGGTAGELADSTQSPELVVEIVGAVVRPGVFRLPPGSRIGDLIDAAGGYGTRVDTSRASHELNLAAVLHDGDQVRVPSRDDAPAGPVVATPAGAGASDGRSGPLDLNSATSAELEALPGIGPVTAGKILSSREEQPFAAVDDLRTRKLLGEKTFDSLKDLVTVR